MGNKVRDHLSNFGGGLGGVGGGLGVLGGWLGGAAGSLGVIGGVAGVWCVFRIGKEVWGVKSGTTFQISVVALVVSVVALRASVVGLVASLVLSGSFGVGGCCVVCFPSW